MDYLTGRNLTYFIYLCGISGFYNALNSFPVEKFSRTVFVNKTCANPWFKLISTGISFLELEGNYFQIILEIVEEGEWKEEWIGNGNYIFIIWLLYNYSHFGNRVALNLKQLNKYCMWKKIRKNPTNFTIREVHY